MTDTEKETMMKEWDSVKETLVKYGAFPYRNGKGSYTLYCWDNKNQKLRDFWDTHEASQRRECGLTAHMKDGQLYIYELGFSLKARRSASLEKKGKGSLDKPMAPYIKKALDKKSLEKRLASMSLGGLLFEVLFTSKVRKIRERLIKSLLEGGQK